MSNGLIESRLATLSRGRILAAVDAALSEAFAHCAEMPSLDKCRDVKLTISLKPMLEEGMLAVNIGSAIRTSFPGVKGPSDRAYFNAATGFRVMEGESSVERQLDVVDFAARAARGSGE